MRNPEAAQTGVLLQIAQKGRLKKAIERPMKLHLSKRVSIKML
jgi:hypothetical protein